MGTEPIKDLSITFNDSFFNPDNAPKTTLKVIFKGFGELRPLKDITPEENAWLSILLLYAGAAAVDFRANPDYAGFIHEHHLERHFTLQNNAKSPE